MIPLAKAVEAAKAGDVKAYERLVEATRPLVFALAFRVLGERAMAEDAVQEAYLRAFRRLRDLEEPASFQGWLRRIVVTVAINMRRQRRTTFVPLDDPEVPVLDDAEERWSEQQRRSLAEALLTLTAAERRVCDRRYYGRWPVRRLAAAAGIDEAAMRKRLQRIREKLRREMEEKEMAMAKENGLRPEDISPELPAKVADLLARPRLTDLPDNPVGKALEALRSVFADFSEQDLPEVVDLSEAKSIAREAVYVNPVELHRLDGERILRYDLTLPLLLEVRYADRPLRLWASGKVYRACQTDAEHLEAFHQAEALWMDERERVDHWQMTVRVLQAMELALPGRALKIVPTRYPMCSQAWELEVDVDGSWSELLAWGVFGDRIVSHLGGDPERHSAIGVGFGLERIAMARYGIDDIRKIEMAEVA